ncbi:hypothetical protein I3843_05G120900 [Carya illinoinensis]|nr:hypothetical protein I3843_05G120900 [Carya illinoinensis]
MNVFLGAELGDNAVSMDLLDATIISSNFWPPIQLELQFEDRAVQFTVAPIHAANIMQFQEQTSWTSQNLAAAIGIPVYVLNRRINFWINKGILAESLGAESSDHVFTLMEGMVETGKNGGDSGSCEELLVGDEEGQRSVASAEDQIRKEMTVCEKFIMGMLTNFGSMGLDRIHNTLKLIPHMIKHYNSFRASYLV